MICPPEQDLAAFTLGGLSDAEREPIEEHLDDCGQCRMVAAELLRSAAPTSGPAPASRSTSGRPQIGRFEVLRTLGSGAMGVVHLARDPVLKRNVAVKVMRSSTTQVTDDDIKSRMLQEARTMAQLAHENVVTIHEVGFHGDSLFIAMEHIRGVDLREWLTESRPWSEVLEVFRQAGRGLHAAHEAGLIHRDFKPDNVLIAEDGRVRVSDFGLARSSGHVTDIDADSFLSQRPITATGALLGTPAYMAPEQWAGDELSAATDQFSFAVALYEGLYRTRPFEADSTIAIAQRVREEPPWEPPADSPVPRVVFDVLCRALAKVPAERFPSIAELLAALDRAERQVLEAGGSPYVGLVAFDESRAMHFFGRDRETQTVVDKLVASPLVAVIGPSGVGKSSLIRAGALPQLRALRPTDRVERLCPGRHPLGALAVLGESPLEPATWVRSCVHRHGRLLVIVDQLEELFALDHPEERRRCFLDCLVALCESGHARVLLSLRADFLDRVAEHRRFSALLSAGVVMLGPPDRDTLTEALVLPAELRGYSFESRTLVDAIVGELVGTPGALPLLQFAAQKLWTTRDQAARKITDAGYRAMGTVSGALAAHADRVLAGLPAPDRANAKAVFRRLVTGSETRNLVSEEELADVVGSADATRRLLSVLDDQRLVVRLVDQGEPVVALSHESLIAGWPTLRAWLDESHEFADLIAELRVAARGWTARERSSELLWTGLRLEELRVALRRADPDLTEAERAFVTASEGLAARSARRRRALRIFAVAALALVAAGTSVGLYQVRAAEQRASRAAQTARRAEAKVQAQLDEVLAAQNARAAAEADARKAEVVATRAQQDAAKTGRELKLTYAELEDAVARYRQESRRAQQAAEAERRAVVRLEKMLAAEKERRREAERNRGIRATTLNK